MCEGDSSDVGPVFRQVFNPFIYFDIYFQGCIFSRKIFPPSPFEHNFFSQKFVSFLRLYLLNREKTNDFVGKILRRMNNFLCSIFHYICTHAQEIQL